MTFREQLGLDIQDAFANTDEFFSDVDIDGKKMRVMTDDYELLNIEKFGKNSDGHGMEAPKKTHVLIYVPAQDYGPRPKINKILLMHKKRQYRIVHVDENAGMYVFTLEANKTS